MLGSPVLRRSIAASFVFFPLVACGGGDLVGTSASGGGGSGGASSTRTGAVAPTGAEKPGCGDPGGPMGSTPPARGDTAGVLGPDGQTFLLFGGDTAVATCNATPSAAPVGDTWRLDAGCGSWTEISPASSPGARSRHAMALDAKRGRALLFGGRTRSGSSGPYSLLADVWAFDFATSAWAEVPTTGSGPSPRSGAAIAVVGDRLVVFGGDTSTDGQTYAPAHDTFVLDLATSAWAPISPSGTGPAARLFHAMAADPSAPRVYVHAGRGAASGPYFSDLWALDLDAVSWTDLQATNGGDGTGRIELGLSARAAGAGTLLDAFAGRDDGPLGHRNDVLSVLPGSPGPAWAAVRKGDQPGSPSTGACPLPADAVKEDPASPERRSAFAFGARADGAAWVVVGGQSDCGALSDAWWFDAIAGTWTPIRESLVGVSCPRTGSTSCASLCG